MTENLAQNLAGSLQEVPEQVCVHLLKSGHPDRAITYRELWAGAAGYARALSRAGVESGQVVILILDHGPDLIFAFFGSVFQGAIPSIMPFLTEKLVPEPYRASLEALFRVTHPGAVITQQEFQTDVRLAEAAIQEDIPILLSEPARPQTGEQPEAFPGLQRSPDEIVLLQHSSGTTGLQKGVALSHRAVFNQLESYGRAILANHNDVVVSWLPLYHDMGLIAGFLLPVLSRVPLVLMSPFDWVRAPYRLFQAVSRYHGTLTWLPNFAYNFCAQKIRDRDLEGVDLSSWRAVINCSEPMYWESHEMFFERFRPYGLRWDALATCYAMAENVFAVTQGGIDRPVKVDLVDPLALTERQAAEPPSEPQEARKMLSAGPPIDNTRVRVLGPDGAPLPERRIGEIALQSDCMLTGYYRRPELTQKAFLDGWYLTGDLGYLAGGELYITGRKKDLIIVGGKNIYPQDLERLADSIPGVHSGRVVAFGIPNPRSGTEDVVLIAEADTADPERRQAIAAAIRQSVTRGSDVALRYVHVVDRGWLLKTSSGKIARGANREKYLAEIGS